MFTAPKSTITKYLEAKENAQDLLVPINEMIKEILTVISFEALKKRASRIHKSKKGSTRTKNKIVA